MLIFLFLISILRSSSSAPLAASSRQSDGAPILLSGRQVPGRINVVQDRTIQDIVLSCLATVFACTWVAVHPNLPGPWDSGWTKFKRKVVMMIYALLAPEFMALWALKQRVAAGNIAKSFNQTRRGDDSTSIAPENILKSCWVAIWSTVEEWCRGPDYSAPDTWTITHGFFVQMGGFILYDGKVPERVLTFSDLQTMIEEGQVEVPDIAERDINDKSKGDLLTKLIVVLQTTWFIFQSLARWFAHLQVTELEVATLAFAALNIITYTLWWQKPQNVEVAVRLQLKGTEDADGRIMEGEMRTEGAEDKESRFIEALREAMDDGWFGLLVGVPFVFFRALYHPLHKMVGTNDSDVRAGWLRMPMFYADRLQLKDFVPFMAISVLFGAFHLIPWSSPFPSTTELWLWRSSALFITAHPVLMAIFATVSKSNRTTLATLYFYSLPLYCLARLILLGLAFSTLRDLPPSTYKGFEWTTFFPHL